MNQMRRYDGRMRHDVCATEHEKGPSRRGLFDSKNQWFCR